MQVFVSSACCFLSVQVSYGDRIIKNLRVGTGLTPPYFCVCPNPEHGLPISYVVDAFVFNNLKGDVIVRFVDIGGVVDHHCLSLSFS